ncbi:bifunctional class I SAM-dependent methyltransferase/HIT family protein [uncultured Bacteroides sp.]|uniref:bifunctional class I SAM-dependent methyltransferase/HIT family protein n=1 Tax=uncultured Bacteroides sp. TaxID=162156 RepID=UPI00260AE187|nr:bifunctional class I SAM-dependent methyltransferase/HIT family protein [uncultured Bacteroides sp.]
MTTTPVNHPHLTALKRTTLSAPARYLMEHGLLKGEILDFGCGYAFDTEELGRRGYSVTGYDNYYRPEYPCKKFDTIICIYVLNVLEPIPQTEVLMTVSQLLKPGGKAYFAVRRDLKTEGFRLHAIYKEYTYQCNVKLPYRSIAANASYEIYEYVHYNRRPRNEETACPFCNLSPQIELLCESATCVSFLDGYPVSPGHALIIPKRHVANYFDLTQKETQAMQLMLKHVKQLLDERYHPDGYNIGVNVNEAAGQSVFHVHMHLIPRYVGDVEEPKGGVRGVIPGKQKYSTDSKSVDNMGIFVEN